MKENRNVVFLLPRPLLRFVSAKKWMASSFTCTNKKEEKKLLHLQSCVSERQPEVKYLLTSHRTSDTVHYYNIIPYLLLCSFCILSVLENRDLSPLTRTIWNSYVSLFRYVQCSLRNWVNWSNRQWTQHLFHFDRIGPGRDDTCNVHSSKLCIYIKATERNAMCRVDAKCNSSIGFQFQFESRWWRSETISFRQIFGGFRIDRQSASWLVFSSSSSSILWAHVAVIKKSTE